MEDDINVDDDGDDVAATSSKTVKRPSVFSVTSLLAPDNRIRSPPPPPHHPKRSLQPQSFRPPPFFYPGLTLDMLNKSTVGRNAAAAAALAAAAAASGAGHTPSSPPLPMFPFPGLMKTAAAAAAASIDANR